MPPVSNATCRPIARREPERKPLSETEDQTVPLSCRFGNVAEKCSCPLISNRTGAPEIAQSGAVLPRRGWIALKSALGRPRN